MEGKAIIYIIVAVLYVLYTIGKKVQEKKQEAQKNTPNAPQQPKPVSAPAHKPLGDIMRELKKKQAELEAKQARPVMQTKPVPKPLTQPKRQQDTTLQEMRKAAEMEGQENSESASVKRQSAANEKKEMEEIYEQKTETRKSYQLDARQAFIGSIIFERKY